MQSDLYLGLFWFYYNNDDEKIEHVHALIISDPTDFGVPKYLMESDPLTITKKLIYGGREHFHASQDLSYAIMQMILHQLDALDRANGNRNVLGGNPLWAFQELAAAIAKVQPLVDPIVVG